MVNTYDIKRYAEKYPDKCWYIVNDGDMIVDKDTNEIRCHISEFVDAIRKKMHCDFEYVYGCHAMLEITYRCKECGTVIFAAEDERWEPNLCCPVCSDYKTGFDYWTGEEIAASEEKQNTIAFLEKMQADQVEADKRYKQRGNKYDWQIGSGKIKLFQRAVFWDLECDNLFETKLKGLKLKIHWAHKEDGSYVYRKNFFIPLSISAFKIKRMIAKEKVATA